MNFYLNDREINSQNKIQTQSKFLPAEAFEKSGIFFLNSAVLSHYC